MVSFGGLKCLCFVEERVTLLGIGLDRAVVPANRFIEFAEFLALLREAIEDEPIVGFGRMEGEKFRESFGARGRHGGPRSGQAGTLQPMAWQSPRLLRFVFAAFLGCSLTLLVNVSCSTAPPGTPVVDEDEAKLPPVPKSMRVVSSFGGVHRKAEIHEGVWYQAFANRMLFLDAQSGTKLTELELAPRGTTGHVQDFVRIGKKLYVVLEGDQVVEVDITVVRIPVITRRWTTAELGVAPHVVASVKGEPFVGGVGGALRLADAKAMGEHYDEDGKPIPPVPPTPFLAGKTVDCIVDADGGPVGCVGRRILRLEDAHYLGAANKLFEMSEEWGGGYGFLLQASEGAQVGLMSRDFREVSSSGLRGTVHTVRSFDDRFFAINDFEVSTWKLEPADDETKPSAAETSENSASDTAAGARGKFRLGATLSVPVKGALDIAKVQRNRFAVCGTFGRALYRYLPEGDASGDTFYAVERVPGRLDVSVTDRRRILAASGEGSWMYLIGEEAELTQRPIASPDRPEFSVEASWGIATMSDDRKTVTFSFGERSQIHEPTGGSEVSTLALADGKVWIGHARGIDVIEFDPITKQIALSDYIRLNGPMVALYPNRVGGGVAYVAKYSGFGVIRPVADDAPPIVAKGCVDGSPAKNRGASSTGDSKQKEKDE